MKKIPYNKQKIFSDDIAGVIKTLKSDFLTSGPTVKKFEEKLKKYFNVKYCETANSATSALNMACQSLNIQENSYAWTTPITFVATANSILNAKLKIDFIDIDYETNNICVKKLSEKLKRTKKNKLPKLLVVVHMAGVSCDMQKIFLLSKKYKFKIIEDASHALGSYYKNEKVGSCKYSDACILSFHPVKNITTAEGGAVLTNKKNLYEKSKSIKNNGLILLEKPRKNLLKYDQLYLGQNYKINEIQASLGITQMRKINLFRKKNIEIFNYYKKKLENLPIQIPNKINKQIIFYHLYIIKIKKKNLSCSRNELFNFFKKKNIEINFHYTPIYKFSLYKNKFSKLKICEKYNCEAYSMPIFYDLTKLDIDKIVNLLKQKIVK